MKAGIIFRPMSLWVGVHYSSYNKRLCINLFPCITLWIIKRGGKMPETMYELTAMDVNWMLLFGACIGGILTLLMDILIRSLK